MSDFQLFIDSIKYDSDEEIENKFKIEFLEMEDKDSCHPLHHACRYGRIGLVKLLIFNHCKIDSVANKGYQPIHFACKHCHVDILKILIDNKCDINALDKVGDQPLHFACENGHIDIVKLLITNKCDINGFYYWRYQPIHLACKKGNIDIVKILINNKCDINASDKWGCQSIHIASKKGHTDIVKILIENQCDINASDYWGYQPIHLACEKGHIDIVKILISNKCKRNVKTKYGELPIDIAKNEGHDQIVDILLNADPIYLIVNSMNLQCQIGCDHKLCRQSVEDETFTKGELIGSRTFWKVYKNKISNKNIEIVIKQTKYVCEDNKYIEGIINIFSSRILHRNIVRYFGALEISGMLYVFMEYLPGGSLKNLIDKSKWIEYFKVIKFSKQILEGLQYIHSQGIIHRDIRPDNMLLDHDETLKLTDFALCKSMRVESYDGNTEKTERFCYTSNYLAPEVLLGEHFDYPADIWSTGASIIHMTTGEKPYHSLPPEIVMFRIATTKKIEFTVCQPITETMQSFIDDLLKPDQSERPTAKFLLEHSIFEHE